MRWVFPPVSLPGCMAEHDRAAILIFARAPVPGQAKTRLAPAIGNTAAAHLHAGMVEKTLETASRVAADLQLWCSPDTLHPFFHQCGDRFGASLHAQSGGDLGQRMANSLESALLTHARAVLFGTDCPSLRPADLEKALNALESGDDWVVGPALDGGYYLIGTSSVQSAVFSDIDWGTAQVFRQTRERIAGLGQSCAVQETKQDVDTPADLISFPSYKSVVQRGKEIVELAG